MIMHLLHIYSSLRKSNNQVGLDSGPTTPIQHNSNLAFKIHIKLFNL